MRRVVARAAVIAIGTLLCINPSTATASTVLVTTESGITNDGLFGLNSLGPESTNVTGFTANIPGIAGLTMTASGANLERRDQGSGWLGNFGPGEQLVFTTTPGLMSFAFNTPITGFGSQIEANLSGAFTARIEAFDASNASLGFVTMLGNSTLGTGDDSAIFIGILSSTNNIRRVTVDVPAFQNFAINSPRIQGGGQGEPVPEPASIALMGLGLAGGGWWRRRRRNRA